MKIDDLEEYKGITSELVHAYLNRKGWCSMPDPYLRLLKPAYVVVSFKNSLSEALDKIAAIEARSIQALLRDINPRMRISRPSDAALKAHNGKWLCRENVAGSPLQIIDCSHGRMALPQSATANMLFWPIDKEGNKVCWPIPAELG